ncbi:MAG TPA: enoyl-CoA hydratase-related protein, partial [Acidimicrobiales bacterium]|nr:enoyl-CoA hydratase-related protein [Acidimicrobiales bacterium]
TLPRAIGQQRAADLLFTGHRIGGEDARAIGLCDQLVDDAALRPASIDLARAIASSGPLAVRAIRATLREGLVDDVRRAMDRERTEQETLRVTKDFAEGIRATAERREPRFTGE